MEDIECELFASTFNYGNISSEDDIYASGPDNLKDLQFEAINRNINISYPFHIICNSIKNELPSIDWQTRNLLDMSNPNLVSREELNDVNNYGNYSYNSMNEYLRINPNKKAPINDIIAKMKPLDKDIIVFRYIKKFDFLPPIGEIFKSYGYLSTTMSASLITKTQCKPNKGAVMRIHVPKGTKCIYLPGNERELLFSHGIELKLINISHNKFYCFSNNEFTSNNNIVLFDLIML
jgi:hypothetical protein